MSAKIVKPLGLEELPSKSASASPTAKAPRRNKPIRRHIHLQGHTGIRLAILIAVLSLIGGTGFFTQQFQVDRMARSVVKTAELAEKAGDLVEAEKLYRQYLEVVPEDGDVKIKCADVLLKVDRSQKRLMEAFQIYSSILKRTPGREDAQRRLMQLKIDQGQFNSISTGIKRVDGAELDLQILLERSPNDGNLLFLRGRCYEEGGDFKKAALSYEKAIKNNAPERIEAYQRRATLLRNRLNQPKEADQAIETMVQSDPQNYKVYIARGRYRLSDPDQSKRKSLLQIARDDFQKALQCAPAEPAIYFELAKTFEDDKSGRDEERRILEKGLKKAPTSVALHMRLAILEERGGQVDKAFKILEDGVKKVSEPGQLRWMLALLFAEQGANVKLDSQIVELRKLDVPKVQLDYLTALWYLNIKDFLKARQLLLPLQGGKGLPLGYKARVNNLLAQCSRQLGEPEMEQQAYRQALIDNPQDLTARLGTIENLVKQGETEEAIKKYQALVKELPGVRLDLAQLLIARNRRRPESQRDWSEVKGLIEEAAKAAPESVDPVIFGAELLLAQDKVDEALNVLEKARLRFPKSVNPWTARAILMGRQGRVDEALSLLDQAQRQLGDQVGLRLARGRLWAIKGGPQVLKAWNDLSQNIGSFSKEDRRRLLRELAEISRQQDPPGASRLLSQLAEEDPNNIEIRLALFNLALETDSKDDIKKNIEQIGRIQGNEGLLGRYCQVLYLIRQAGQERDKKKQEELRISARVLLNELISRRRDWSVIPLAFAELEEQELVQGGLTVKERQAREGSIISYYLQVIQLGQRQPAVVRRAVQLLFKNDRGNEAVKLLNSIPVELQLAGDLGRQAEQFAFDKKDFKRAEQIARKAVAANPGDFQERLRLVEILLNDGRPADAEVALREAVDLSKSDPKRWISLVRFLVSIKQPVKAEQAIRDAEANLPRSQAPLALAQCCELVGRAYETGKTDDAMKKWYADAKKWYEKALAAQPDDLSIKRRLTEFFLDTKQASEAKSQLDAILKQGAGTKNTETVAWAKRKKALVLAHDADYQQVRKALSLFEPAGQPAASGQEGKTLEDPEDLRVLARVLDLQRTPQHRKRAIEILESLTDKKLVTSEDQFLLAQLYEISQDWPKAREKYRELNLRTKNPRDLETLNRRPLYLAQFAASLLRHRRPGEEQDLTDAQELINELEQLQPNALGTLVLQVEIDLARNQLENAAKLIQAFADRPQPTPQVLGTLANLAEKLGQFDLAEKLYRQLAVLPAAPRGKIELAKFLGRRDRPKQALDICELLWSNTGEIEGIVKACIDVLLGGKSEPDPAQLDRVCGWLEQALEQKQGSTLLLVSLANLREKQERYKDAEDLYRRAVKLGDGNGVSDDSQYIATSYNNLAWLMALYDGKGQEALEYIKHAITLTGPQPDFLDTRGVVYLTVGEYQRAIFDLENAIAADPSASKYFHLAQADLKVNNKEKAKKNLTAAKTLGLPALGQRGGLHRLELPAYQKVLTELGAP